MQVNSSSLAVFGDQFVRINYKISKFQKMNSYLEIFNANESFHAYTVWDELRIMKEKNYRGDSYRSSAAIKFENVNNSVINENGFILYGSAIHLSTFNAIGLAIGNIILGGLFLILFPPYPFWSIMLILLVIFDIIVILFLDISNNNPTSSQKENFKFNHVRIWVLLTLSGAMFIFFLILTILLLIHLSSMYILGAGHMIIDKYQTRLVVIDFIPLGIFLFLALKFMPSGTVKENFMGYRDLTRLIFC